MPAFVFDNDNQTFTINGSATVTIHEIKNVSYNEDYGLCGFHIPCEIGATFSVLMGSYTYSSNHDVADCCRDGICSAETVEVAMFDTDGNWITPNMDDDVIGYVDAEQFVQLLLMTNNMNLAKQIDSGIKELGA